MGVITCILESYKYQYKCCVLQVLQEARAKKKIENISVSSIFIVFPLCKPLLYFLHSHSLIYYQKITLPFQFTIKKSLFLSGSPQFIFSYYFCYSLNGRNKTELLKGICALGVYVGRKAIVCCCSPYLEYHWMCSLLLKLQLSSVD